MTCEIYWASGSPYSWTVLLGLEIKGLKYNSKLLSFAQGDLKTEDFLALNPRAKVPVLRDGDTAIHESIAILAYLDKKYNQLPLFGANAVETGHIWQKIFELEHYLVPSIMAVVQPIFSGKALEKMQKVKEAAETLQPELQHYEAILSDSAYLAGPAISAVDIILFPLLKCLLRAVEKQVVSDIDLGISTLETCYPRLDDWRQRIETLPCYERTYPPHWRA